MDNMDDFVIKNPDVVYAVVENGKPTGMWSLEQFDGAVQISINPDDFQDFNDTEGGIFDVISGVAEKVRDKDTWIQQRKRKHNNLLQIQSLKTQLAAMDYKTSKHADGDYSEEEWQQIVAERKGIREQIRALETEVQ